MDDQTTDRVQRITLQSGEELVIQQRRIEPGPHAEYSRLSDGRVRVRSQIRHKLVVEPQNPDQVVVLSEGGGERILSWCSKTNAGTGVIEIAHEGELSKELNDRHNVTVNGFLATFEGHGAEVAPRASLEATPPDDRWARIMG
jgi:hypothetical protein